MVYVWVAMNVCLRKGIKKGIPLYPNLVNLKSNTMKNTMQKYGFPVFLQGVAGKNCHSITIFKAYAVSLPTLIGISGQNGRLYPFLRTQFLTEGKVACIAQPRYDIAVPVQLGVYVGRP